MRFIKEVNMSKESQPGFRGDLSPKQRFEMERWARLHGMTMEEFIINNIAEQQRVFRNIQSQTSASCCETEPNVGNRH